MDRKVMAGQRVRRLRREQNLTQAKMAEQLGVSTSYLNLIERNQRPVTVQFLLKLGQTFDIDLQRFAEDDEGRSVAQLKEVFGDPLFAKSGVTDQDIHDAASASPALSEAVSTLYRAYRDLVDNTMNLAEGLGRVDTEQLVAGMRFPGEDAQDFMEAQGNYLPELEQAAEGLWAEAQLDKDALYEGLRDYLMREHTVRVRIMPFEVMQDTIRRFDRHGRRILLSEILTPEARTYQLAHQIALLTYRELLDTVVFRSELTGEARRLLVISLANYVAGAVLMPYDRFLDAAEALRYDIDLLSQRFGTSYEQVCNRLITLQRPGAKGVPFFLVRIDCAGNVSRRYSAAGFHFARFGGVCPRWGIHRAFRTPGETRTELVQMPDGAGFFTIARMVSRPGAGHALPAQQFVVAIGCPQSYAERLVYAQNIGVGQPDTATPIGVNCRLCDRVDCNRRAYPPLNRRLIVDENQQSIAPYFFA